MLPFRKFQENLMRKLNEKKKTTQNTKMGVVCVLRHFNLCHIQWVPVLSQEYLIQLSQFDFSFFSLDHYLIINQPVFFQFDFFPILLCPNL